ncbi:MAG TPA: Fe-S cluster assembly protein IscX [Melioribacteraceae bacterium]|nr:Fe-S cluster assembly protein IscX [Melioribacteraceae bacterium]
MDTIITLIKRIYSPQSPDFITSDTSAIEELFVLLKIPEDVFELELLFTKLSLSAIINWNNYVIIARALNQIYPEIDLLSLTDDDLRKKVIALPNFSDSEFPKDNDYYTAIFTTWNILRNDLF